MRFLFITFLIILTACQVEEKKEGFYFNEFRVLVEETYPILDATSTPDSAFAIKCLKIHNTIRFYDLDGLPLFSIFNHEMKGEIKEKCLEVLDCKFHFMAGYLCPDSTWIISRGIFASGTYYELKDEYFRYLKSQLHGE